MDFNKEEELNSRISCLEADVSQLRAKVTELEAKNWNLEYEIKNKLVLYDEMLMKLRNLTLPNIRNLIESDRYKIGEYLYGKALYEPNY